MIALLKCVRVMECFDAVIVQSRKAKAQLIEMKSCECPVSGLLTLFVTIFTAALRLFKVLNCPSRWCVSVKRVRVAGPWRRYRRSRAPERVLSEIALLAARNREVGRSAIGPEETATAKDGARDRDRLSHECMARRASSRSGRLRKLKNNSPEFNDCLGTQRRLSSLAHDNSLFGIGCGQRAHIYIDAIARRPKPAWHHATKVAGSGPRALLQVFDFNMSTGFESASRVFISRSRSKHAGPIARDLTGTKFGCGMGRCGAYTIHSIVSPHGPALRPSLLQWVSHGSAALCWSACFRPVRPAYYAEHVDVATPQQWPADCARAPLRSL